jgi:hypothetical protein
MFSTIFPTYSDFAPVLTLLTLVLSLVVGRNVTRESLRGIDGILAALGFLFGIFMTLLNLVYTSKDLFLLSPTIALSCIVYLRYRSGFKEERHGSLLRLSDRNNTILSIIWWSLISAALVTYYFSEIYTRHPLFFILISGAVAVLGVQIITFRDSNKRNVLIFIVKILLLSLILRASAYFISPYPTGPDSWSHAEYISYFLDYGEVTVPPDFLAYYVNYPMAHLHAVCTSLLTSISPHDVMFLWAVILTLSTIVTFLIVWMLTGNAQLALISMLLLNFLDDQIQWCIHVMAMTYGIAIYAFIIFLALMIYLKPEDKIRYIPFMLVFLGIIVWTHTISAFITLVSLMALIVGYILYEILYSRNTNIWNILSFRSQNVRLLMVPLVFLAVIITYHWMDPSYSFFDKSFGGLFRSLSQEVEFLGATTLSNVHGRWEELLQPIGFCIYVFFGIIGTLYCSSHKEQAKKYFPLIVLALVLFFVRYAFPIFGMRDILPARWPAFAFVCFVLFVGFGVYCALSLLKSKKVILCAVAICFFIGSFFMIAGTAANQDSPLFGEEVFTKSIWTESEMNMYVHINKTYDGTIIADHNTMLRIFEVYLKKNSARAYKITREGQIDVDVLSQGLVVWRKSSLNRPTTCADAKYVTNLLLGDEFYRYLDNNYSCIVNTCEGRGFL